MLKAVGLKATMKREAREAKVRRLEAPLCEEEGVDVLVTTLRAGMWAVHGVRVEFTCSARKASSSVH